MDEYKYILKEKSYKCYAVYLLMSFIILPIIMSILSKYINNVVLSAFLNFFGYLVMTIILSIILYKYILDDFKSIKTNLIMCIVVLVLAIPLVKLGEELCSLFYGLFNMELTSNNQESIINSIKNGSAILMGLSICLFAPITEELIFRKCIFAHFKNDWIAIAVSTAIFSLIHVLSSLDFIHILPYVLTGFIFSLAYKLTKRNIIINILIHISVNTISFILILISI